MAKKLRFPKKCRLKDVVDLKTGSELVSDKPTQLRATLVKPATLREKMTTLWKEMRERQEYEDSEETLADAQDFDVSNEEIWHSPYECEGEVHELMEQQEELENYNKQKLEMEASKEEATSAKKTDESQGEKDEQSSKDS
jgi:hypothetical protein